MTCVLDYNPYAERLGYFHKWLRDNSCKKFYMPQLRPHILLSMAAFIILGKPLVYLEDQLCIHVTQMENICHSVLLNYGEKPLSVWSIILPNDNRSFEVKIYNNIKSKLIIIQWLKF